MYDFNTCFIQKFKIVLGEHLNMKEIDAEFYVQKSQIKCKISQ